MAEILARFPKTWVLDYGAKVTVRPMVKEDRDKLAEFFKKIPEGDLKFLKDDVTDVRVIDQWVRDLNYERALPLVVEMNGRIIADASLHRRKEKLAPPPRQRTGGRGCRAPAQGACVPAHR
ncbi:MAG: hypothetical protein ACREIZ_00770 [Candidatus Methylomirabilales bacterium]